MEIKRKEVMERVGSESEACHYYSAAPSERDYEAVKRVMRVPESRHALVAHRVDSAMESLLARLWGWAESGSVDAGRVQLTLKEAYRPREGLMRAAAVEMLAAEVWRSIVAQQWPERAQEAEERCERAEDRLMCVGLGSVRG